MNLREYQQQVTRTANPLPKDESLKNMTLGLCGEAGELAAVHYKISESAEGFIGEGGDVAYYACMVANLLGICLEDVPAPMHYALLDNDRLMIEILVNSARVAELIKKHYYHGKGLPSAEIGARLAFIIAALSFMAKRQGDTVEAIFDANAMKLTARYPDGFKVNHGHAPY